MSANSKNTSTGVPKETAAAATKSPITNEELKKKTMIPLLAELRQLIDQLQTTVGSTTNEPSCKKMTPYAEAVIKKGDEVVNAIRKANISESNARSHTQDILVLTEEIRNKCKKIQQASSSQNAKAAPQNQAAPQGQQEVSREDQAKSRNHMETGKGYNYGQLPFTDFSELLFFYKQYLKGDKKNSFGSSIDAKRTDPGIPDREKETINRLYDEYEEYKRVGGQNWQYSAGGTPSFTTYIDDRYAYKLENDPSLQAEVEAMPDENAEPQVKPESNDKINECKDLIKGLKEPFTDMSTFKKWARTAHPNKGGDTATFQKASECAKILYEKQTGGAKKGKTRKQKSKRKAKKTRKH